MYYTGSKIIEQIQQILDAISIRKNSNARVRRAFKATFFSYKNNHLQGGIESYLKVFNTLKSNYLGN